MVSPTEEAFGCAVELLAVDTDGLIDSDSLMGLFTSPPAPGIFIWLIQKNDNVKNTLYIKCEKSMISKYVRLEIILQFI